MEDNSKEKHVRLSVQVSGFGLQGIVTEAETGWVSDRPDQTWTRPTLHIHPLLTI